MKDKQLTTNKISRQCKVARLLGIISISTSIIVIGLIVGIVGLVYANMGKKKATNKADLEKAELGFKLSIAGIIVGTVMAIAYGVGAFFITKYIWEHVVW